MPIAVSFVIPTLNSERYIARCLDSIREQDFDLDQIEIIVADGGSTDRTRQIAASFGAQVADNPGRSGEAGKVVGARLATGSLIVFLDSDNELVGADWLRRNVKPFDDPAIVACESIYWDTEAAGLS